MGNKRSSVIAGLAGVFALSSPAWAAPDVATSALTVGLSLVLILGGFVAVAWFARRYLPGAGQTGLVKVVGSAAVGPRERVVVVEVDGTRLVLGVANGSVCLLHGQPVVGEPRSPEEGA